MSCFKAILQRNVATQRAGWSVFILLLILLATTPVVQAQQTLKVGLYENPPKIFSNSQGKASGLFVEILNAIASRENWQVEYIHCDWDECLQMLEQGQLDLMPDVAYSAERDKRFDFHRVPVLSNWTLIYSPSPRSMQSVLDLQDKRIAVIAGSIQYSILKRRLKEFDIQAQFVEEPGSWETMKAVASDKADAALVNRLFGQQYASEFDLKPTHILVESSPLYFATTRGRHKELLATIDQQLTQLKSDRRSAYFKALSHWVEPIEKPQTPVWIVWMIEALAVLVVILIIVSLTLKHLVRRQTSQLLQGRQALEQSEAMFHTLFTTSQDAMMFASGDTFINCNPAMLKMFLYSSVEEMQKIQLVDLFPPHQPDGSNSATLAAEYINEAFDKGYASFEWIHRRADGSTFPSEVTLVPMVVHNRELIQATIRDISQRKQSELALLQLNRALKTLSKVNHTLVHSRDESTLLQNICRTIVEVGQYRLAWVGIAQYDEERTVQPVAQHGFIDGYLDNLKISWQNDEFGQGPTGIAIRTGKPSIVQDIHNNPRYTPWREQAERYGYASSIALPLVSSGTTFGALNIYSHYPDAFGEKEVTLLMELAEDISFGIHTQRLKLEHTTMEEERQGNRDRLQNALLNTVNAITVMVEKRDPFTAGHQRRVADLAVAIAKELGIDDVRIEGIRFGAMIHDIGNIYVPAEILNRPGKLSDAELDIVRSHPSVGYDIIKDIDFPWPIASMILHHHERLDGSGYPDGLAGDAIPLEARIVGVADLVEAMLSHRPYRASHSIDETLDVLEAGSGSKYDSSIVDACVRLFRNKGYTLPV